MRYRKRNVEISGRADVIKNIHSCTSEDIDENIKRRCPSGALHRGMLVYLRHLLIDLNSLFVKESMKKLKSNDLTCLIF